MIKRTTILAVSLVCAVSLTLTSECASSDEVSGETFAEATHERGPGEEKALIVTESDGVGGLYLSLNGSFGKRSIPVRIQSTGEELQERSFDGGDIGLTAGYDITRTIGVEFGLAYSQFGYSSCGDNVLCLFGASGEFTDHPLTATLVYHFYRFPGHPRDEFHLGFGVEYHMSPTLEYNHPVGIGFTTSTVHYRNAPGYSAGVGGTWSGHYVFISFDVKYVFDLKYKAQEMDVDGVASDTVLPAWRELDGSGVIYGIGIGHHF